MRFGAGQAALVFLAYIGAQLVGGVFVGIAIGFVSALRYGPRVTQMAAEIMGRATMIGAATGMIASALIAWYLARRMVRRNTQGISFETLGWKPADMRAKLGAAAAGAAIGVAFLAITVIIPLPKEAKTGIERAIMGGGWPLYLWTLIAVVLAPPIEEFVFRGLLWTGFSLSWKPMTAALATTGAFVVLHVPQAWAYPPALLCIGLMGVAALVARIVSGSLLPAIIVHMTYNAVVVLATLRAYTQQAS